MPRATCRCGQLLIIPADGGEWVVCSACGSRLRVRPKTTATPPASVPAPVIPAPAAVVGDGFVRFRCDCGKRLKVEASQAPGYGQCPDCGVMVPVPAATASATPLPGPGNSAVATRSGGGAGARTVEMTAVERSRLEAWGRAHAPPGPEESDIPGPSASALPGLNVPSIALAGSAPAKTEAGLRVCPSCRKPVHLSAEVCRHCGTAVPRR